MPSSAFSPFAVTDTHALVWAATGRTDRLGRAARRYFQRAERGDVVIYVPAMAFVEFSEAVHAGRVKLDGSFSDWVDALLGAGPYVAYDLTLDVIRTAETLWGIPERGDRLIAATAKVLDCPLITRDPAIAAEGSVELLWG
jgi:PIN domain nuclease of toxin-antitoxin system